MPNNSYLRGANYERQWVKDAYTSGAIIAGRMAGSRGLIDVFAIYPDKIILSQCKTGSATIAKDDRQKMDTLVERIKASRMPISVRLYTKQARLPVKIRIYTEI